MSMLCGNVFDEHCTSWKRQIHTCMLLLKLSLFHLLNVCLSLLHTQVPYFPRVLTVCSGRFFNLQESWWRHTVDSGASSLCAVVLSGWGGACTKYWLVQACLQVEVTRRISERICIMDALNVVSDRCLVIHFHIAHTTWGQAVYCSDFPTWISWGLLSWKPTHRAAFVIHATCIMQVLAVSH